ncbi:hypothetical protein OQA88_6948 [Cercophora sp. LCS_1]
MNLSLPTRRLAASLPSQTRSLSTTPARPWFWNRKTKTEPETKSPLEKEASGSLEARRKLAERLQSRTTGPELFADETEASSSARAATKSTDGRRKKDAKSYTTYGASLVHEHLARAADPDPRSRVRWERKMVIRAVRNGTNAFSVEPKELKIARTERQLVSKSPFLPTSVKKLAPLARQIAGKTLDEALTQMQFSKKKMAREIKVQLEEARDQAIVERGMGLGLNTEGEKEEKKAGAVKIETKDGRHLEIEDPTRMYVAEAWVSRGPWRAKRPSYRARGRIDLLESPSTGITVVLKEEKTRIREHQERVAKKLRQGPWVHLPDRPITAQRPYYTW